MAEEKEKIFIEGVRMFSPRDGQPDFVIGNGIIEPNVLFAWLKKNGDLLQEYQGQKQLKFNILKAQSGTPYFQVDTWKPDPSKRKEGAKKGSGGSEENSDDLPF